MTIWHDEHPQREGESNADYNARHAAAFAHLFANHVPGARVRKHGMPEWTGTIVRVWEPRWYWMNNTVVQMDDGIPFVGGTRTMGPMVTWEVIDTAPAETLVQLDMFGGAI